MAGIVLWYVLNVIRKLTVVPLWSSLRMERAISTCGPWRVDEFSSDAKMVMK